MAKNNQGTLLRTYNVYYISGLSGYAALIKNVKLQLFSEGFLLHGKIFPPLWIPCSSIVDFKLLAGMGDVWTHASRSGNLLEKLMEITFTDQNQQMSTIKLEMVVSIFSGMPNYRACKQLVKIMKSNNIFEKFATTNATNLSAEILTQIEKLAEMHKSGILTDEEFQAKKAELLSRI